MGRKRNNGLSEEKRNIIGQLIVLAVKHRRSDYQVPGSAASLLLRVRCRGASLNLVTILYT